MNPAGQVEFGIVTAAAGAPGVSDQRSYVDMLRDCELAMELGYGTAWVIEHHFSDYFPMPDPIGLLQHIAGRFPELNLGTCVVVAPWHEPLRLAGSIAQLNGLTRGSLHIGLGRGTAKFEYDAFGIDMADTRARFKEILEILRLALAGGRFTYQGTQFNVRREIEIRPRTDTAKVNLYGAIGNPASAQVMAELDIPPMCTAMGDMVAQRSTLETWKSLAAQRGRPRPSGFPIMVNCIVAETDEEAVEAAKLYIPRFMRAQVDHYTVDETDWEHTKSYEAWSKLFAGLKARCNPDNIPPWAKGQFVGSPETVRAKVQAFVDCGFDNFLVHTATPGVPADVRRQWLRLFAREVVPHFRDAGSRSAATTVGTRD